MQFYAPSAGQAGLIGEECFGSKRQRRGYQAQVYFKDCFSYARSLGVGVSWS
jgi:hypothetical protein